MDIPLRSNSQMAEVVRLGLEIDAVRGSVAAWTYMAGNGVAADTIARVLTSTSRRHGDPPFLNGAPRA
jgi:hypothetical protein